MDECEVESVKDQKEGNVVDFNTANRAKNKSVRRAQVLKDKHRKSKVCNQKVCVCQLAYWHNTNCSCVFKNVCGSWHNYGNNYRTVFCGEHEAMRDFRLPPLCT